MHQPISSLWTGSSHGHQMVSVRHVDLVHLLDRRRGTSGSRSPSACGPGAGTARTRAAGGSAPTRSAPAPPSASSACGCPRARRRSAGTASGSPCTARPTERPPTASDRVPEWQYWQSIWYRPAWCLWLNGIGWSGPGATDPRGRVRETGRRASATATRTPAGSRSARLGSAACRARSSCASHTLFATSLPPSSACTRDAAPARPRRERARRAATRRRARERAGSCAKPRTDSCAANAGSCAHAGGSWDGGLGVWLGWRGRDTPARRGWRRASGCRVWDEIDARELRRLRNARCDIPEARFRQAEIPVLRARRESRCMRACELIDSRALFLE